MRTCRHGVDWSGTRVWNEACARCREERAAYDRQTSRIGGELTHRYREGEFDGVDRAEGYDPAFRDYWSGVRSELSREWSERWKKIRAVGTQYRADRVRRLIAGEEEPEPREDWEKIGPILDAYSADFTDRQRLALTLYYYWALSQREIAALTVVSRSAVQHWLRDALDKVARLEQGASPAQGGNHDNSRGQGK